MKFHPYADVFPKLAELELKDLADDIKAHGQREKIWTYKGQILDGRNRFNACVLAGVTAQFRPFRGTDQEALALVISANMARRHLTVEQRAIAAAKVATLREGANQHSSEKIGSKEEDAPRGAPSQAKAAEQFGVSRRSVQRARKIVEEGSAALQKAVEKGDVPLAKAAAVVDLPKSEQLAAAKAKAEKGAPTESDAPEKPTDDEESEAIQRAEQAWRERMDNVLAADDKLAEMAKQLKQTQGELVAAKQARDRYMNENAALLRQNKALQRKLDRLEKKAA